MASVVARKRPEKRKLSRTSPSLRLDAAIELAWIERQALESRHATIGAVSDCVEEICSRLTDLCRLELTDDDLTTIRNAFVSFSTLE